jgi:hypothetical protein
MVSLSSRTGIGVRDLCKRCASVMQVSIKLAYGVAALGGPEIGAKGPKKTHFVMSWEFPRALNRVFSAGRVEIFGGGGPVLRSSAQSSSKHPVPPSQSYSPTLPHSNPY